MVQGLQPREHGGEGPSNVLLTSTRELQRVCQDESITLKKLRTALKRVPHDRIQQKMGAKCKLGCTPLHYLCSNPSVTAELIHEAHEFHPVCASEKDQVTEPCGGVTTAAFAPPASGSSREA